MRMKETMKGLPSFLTFDTPVDLEYIRSSFADQQVRNQQLIPDWDAPSTRRTLVNRYWYTHVPTHFLLTIGLPILVLWPFIGHFNLTFLVVAMVVALLGFLTLMIAAYMPGFRSKFLPHLDAVISAHKNRQQEKTIWQLREQLAQQQVRSETLQQQSEIRLQEKLSEQQTYLVGQQAARQHEFEQKLIAEKKKVERLMAAQKKCREAQLPNFSLTLIYYVFSQITSNNTLTCTDETAKHMATLYGVDPGSLRHHLELLAGNGSKRKQLGQKKCSGLRDRFEEAYLPFLQDQ